ncbi:MAG: hypothetical protein LBR16_03800 [Treponema sp.]|jgi:hypothetical protein|nr:hypothetical protein [Treponema sp.]
MKQYRDEIAMVCHEMMEDGYRLGMVSDAEMQKFEKHCFVSAPRRTKRAAVSRPQAAPLQAPAAAYAVGG